MGLHISNSGYNVLAHTVSDYGVGKAAGLFRLYVWAGNLGALALSYLFYASVDPRLPAFIPLCLLFMVVARIGVSVFKTDLEGSPRTRQGVAHYLFTILTFTFAYIVIDNAAPLLAPSNKPELQKWLLIGLCYTAMISLFGVVITVFRPLRRFFGSIERVFLLSTIVWFLVAGASFIGK